MDGNAPELLAAAQPPITMTSGRSTSGKATWIRSVKERFKRLQRGPLRWLVALVGTLQQSMKHGSPVVIFVDKEGDWHNRRRDGTFVAPELNVASYRAVRAAATDFWFYDYTPRSGDTVVDVGAGIGDDVLVFSRLVGTNGRVIGIEAHPDTYRCLVKTIAANRLKNVTALNVAVSDQEGHVAISTGDTFLSSSIVGGTGTIRIPARKLDRVLSELGIRRPDLIKMNIEGAETAALQGMEETLRTTPHIVVSCHDFKADRGEDPALRTYSDVNRILRHAGYAIRGRGEDARKEVRYYIYGTRAA